MYVSFGKRVCDIVVGLVALPFVLLIIAVLAPFIHFEDKGPVFYNAPRVGKDGRDFKMYKLRSMRVNAPDLIMEDGSTYNGADDPRMTRVGAFMRKTSLDEMPQFLNVLKGDMSLVGTRPPTVDEYEKYQLHHHARLATKPGITGMWQVSGRSNITDFEEVVRLDTKYIQEWTYGLDIRILLRTVAVVLKREGSM